MFINGINIFKNIKFSGKSFSNSKVSKSEVNGISSEDMELASRIYTQFSNIQTKARKNFVSKVVTAELGQDSQALSKTVYKKIYESPPHGKSKTIAVI